MTPESDLAPEFSTLIGAKIMGFKSHRCHNECANSPDEESDLYEDSVIVEKDGKQFIISAVFCSSIPVEVEESDACIMLSAGEYRLMGAVEETPK